MTNRLLGASLIILAVAGCASYGQQVPPDPPPKLETVPPPPEPVPPPAPPGFELVQQEVRQPLPDRPPDEGATCSGRRQDHCRQGRAQSGNPSGSVVAMAAPPGARASAMMPCPEVRDTVTVADCQAARDQLQMLSEGVAAFNAPDVMTLDKESTVRLVLGAAGDREILLERAGRGGGRIGAFRVAIGGRMTANLTGTAFRITPDQRGEERQIGGGGEEDWLWSVVPTRSGPQQLFLIVKVLGPGGRVLKTFPADPQIIQVTVTNDQARKARSDARIDVNKQRSAETQSWIDWALKIGALIAALSAIVVGIRTFGRKPEKKAT